MISEDALCAILEQYDRHGWRLRRVLLSSELQNKLAANVSALFDDAEIRPSDIDAGWFSRISRERQVTWEIRWFSEFPFALLEVIGDETEPNEVEKILRETENRLRDRIKNRTQGH